MNAHCNMAKKWPLRLAALLQKSAGHVTMIYGAIIQKADGGDI